ncbi:hypothetical protein TRP8649_01283 [Pelagimonas phthalicica]|uniref:Uncharacterized protein n=1 Tax=Pelagimonas phthalicica TaxID=1037362 RepID=A0A238J8Z3_9RHOB|nr:hypothetical protein CLV87_0789 [Pelagimonas phthalicica]SMX27181.1 hypothetical protein TRP8649_01283 [Pelagimonas phthalicica]
MFNILANSMLLASRQNLHKFHLEHPQTPVHLADLDLAPHRWRSTRGSVK